MRLPHWRRPRPVSTEAEAAKREAMRARQDAENFARRVDHVTGKLEETHRRNHIAEAVETVIRPRRQA